MNIDNRGIAQLVRDCMVGIFGLRFDFLLRSSSRSGFMTLVDDLLERLR